MNISWNCFTRTDSVEKNLLKLMKSAGCWSISFGIESGNQKSLDFINKNITIEKNTSIVKLALKMGFYVGTNYILCLPGEKKRMFLIRLNMPKD